MKLSIISLKGIQYQGDVKSLTLTTTSGEITILDKHQPLISSFNKNTATIIDDQNNKKFMELNTGFLEMNSDNKLTVLVDA